MHISKRKGGSKNKIIAEFYKEKTYSDLPFLKNQVILPQQRLTLLKILIEGFSTPYKLYCSSNGCGIALYDRDYFICNLTGIENKLMQRFWGAKLV